MTVITTGSIPVVEIPTGPNQEFRMMPPTAFPFTMQQYRDYDSNQFYYRIVIGWPTGIPIYEWGIENDTRIGPPIHISGSYDQCGCNVNANP